MHWKKVFCPECGEKVRVTKKDRKCPKCGAKFYLAVIQKTDLAGYREG